MVDGDDGVDAALAMVGAAGVDGVRNVVGTSTSGPPVVSARGGAPGRLAARRSTADEEGVPAIVRCTRALPVSGCPGVRVAAAMMAWRSAARVTGSAPSARLLSNIVRRMTPSGATGASLLGPTAEDAPGASLGPSGEWAAAADGAVAEWSAGAWPSRPMAGGGAARRARDASMRAARSLASTTSSAPPVSGVLRAPSLGAMTGGNGRGPRVLACVGVARRGDAGVCGDIERCSVVAASVRASGAAGASIAVAARAGAVVGIDEPGVDDERGGVGEPAGRRTLPSAGRAGAREP